MILYSFLSVNLNNNLITVRLDGNPWWWYQ